MVKSHTKYMVFQSDTNNYEGRTIAGTLVVVDYDTYEREREDLRIREQSTRLVDDPNWWVIWKYELLRSAPASLFNHTPAAQVLPRYRLGTGTIVMLTLCVLPILLILAALR